MGRPSGGFQRSLGLDRIDLQASSTRRTGRWGVRLCRRSLAQLVAQGDRGVFLTTASFTREAIDEAGRVNLRIELIDGKRLAELMLRQGVGVQARTSATLYDPDEDFFDGL